MENIKYYCCGLEYCTDFLDSIFKSYPDGIVCKDSELKYTYINNSYRKLMSVNNSDNLLHFCENKFISSDNPLAICPPFSTFIFILQSSFPYFLPIKIM